MISMIASEPRIAGPHQQFLFFGTISLYAFPSILAWYFYAVDSIKGSEFWSVVLICVLIVENAVVCDIVESTASWETLFFSSVAILTFDGLQNLSLAAIPAFSKVLAGVIFLNHFLALKGDDQLYLFTFGCSLCAWYQANLMYKLRFTFLEHHLLTLLTGSTIKICLRKNSESLSRYQLGNILSIVFIGLATIVLTLFVTSILLTSIPTESASFSTVDRRIFFIVLLICGILPVAFHYRQSGVQFIGFMLGGYHVHLTIYWIFLLTFFIAAAQNLADNSGHPKFCVRKIFHLLMVLIITPGLFIQELFCFTILAIGVALCLFLVLETFRVMALKCPGNDFISTYYDKFIDRKENERLWTSSNISLLVGCAFPAFLWALWLNPKDCFSTRSNCSGFESNTSHSLICDFNYDGGDDVAFAPGMKALRPLLPHLGWITVGVGDSFAAVAGSRFGRYKWPGSSRTVEGTFAMYISTFFTSLLVLHNSGECDNPFSFKVLLPMTFTLVFTSLCEAFSNDNDNITLPLFAVAFYVAIILMIT